MFEVGRLVARIALEGAQTFQRDLQQTGKEFSALSDKGRSSTKEIGVGIAGAGAAIAGLAVAAVARFAEFDKSMSGVRANVEATPAEFLKLKSAAIDAGQSTTYTASEAADAITNLGKAGITSKEILGGGLTGALSLAAAGEMGVADAADVAATAMTQFRLSGKDVPHIADLLTAGANKAQGSVSDMSMALKQSGLVASQMGLSLEDTVGTLTLFAKSGLLGSDAGTSFRTMLLALANPSVKAKDTMRDLGIAAYDAQGNFVGMESIAGQLETRLGGVDQATRDSALATIFGSDAIRAASVLVQKGADGWRDMTEAVQDNGIATRQAATLQDNLSGDIEKLGGSIDSLMIVAGDGANGPLRDLVQGVTGIVDGFGKLPPVVSQSILVVGGVVGVAALAGGAFLIAVPKVMAFRAAISTLNKEVPALRTSLGKVGGFLGGPWGVAITAGLTLLSLFADRQAETAGQVDTLSATLDTQTGRITDNTKAAMAKLLVDEGVVEAAKKAGIGLKTVTDAAMGNEKALAKVADAAKKWRGEQEDGLVSSYENDVVVGKLTDGIGGLAERLDQSKDSWKAVDETTSAATGKTAAATEATKEQALATQLATEAQDEWNKTVGEADAGFIDIQGGIDAVIQKHKDMATETASATKDAGDSWSDYYDGFTLDVGDYLAELQSQVDAQTNWETNMLAISGRVSQGTLNELAKLGPEGAPLVAAMRTMTDAELAQVEANFAKRGAGSTGAFTTKLTEAAPVIAAAAAQLGQGAADEIATKLENGTATVEQIIAEYKLKIEGNPPKPEVKPNIEPAKRTLDQFLTSAQTSMDNRPPIARAQADTKKAGADIDAIADKKRTANVNVEAKKTGTGWSFLMGLGLGMADGGVIRAYANGGVENHVAQIAKAGDYRVWAEDETGGEAYIPLAPGKRARSTSILEAVADRFGLALIPRGATRYADGGAPAVSRETSRGALPISGRLRLEMDTATAWVEGVVDDRLDAENDVRENGFRL